MLFTFIFLLLIVLELEINNRTPKKVKKCVKLRDIYSLVSDKVLNQ